MLHALPLSSSLIWLYLRRSTSYEAEIIFFRDEFVQCLVTYILNYQLATVTEIMVSSKLFALTMIKFITQNYYKNILYIIIYYYNALWLGQDGNEELQMYTEIGTYFEIDHSLLLQWISYLWIQFLKLCHYKSILKYNNISYNLSYIQHNSTIFTRTTNYVIFLKLTS
jgi:hypothetical protein